MARSEIGEYIESNRKLVGSYIKQDVDISFGGIDGMIAKFGIEYKGNRFSIYTKNKEAYLRIDGKTPGYMYTVCVFNLSARGSKRLDVYRGQDKELIDLDTLI